jgi:hypothetical protein
MNISSSEKSGFREIDQGEKNLTRWEAQRMMEEVAKMRDRFRILPSLPDKGLKRDLETATAMDIRPMKLLIDGKRIGEDYFTSISTKPLEAPEEDN